MPMELELLDGSKVELPDDLSDDQRSRAYEAASRLGEARQLLKEVQPEYEAAYQKMGKVNQVASYAGFGAGEDYENWLELDKELRKVHGEAGKLESELTSITSPAGHTAKLAASTALRTYGSMLALGADALTNLSPQALIARGIRKGVTGQPMFDEGMPFTTAMGQVGEQPAGREEEVVANVLGAGLPMGAVTKGRLPMEVIPGLIGGTASEVTKSIEPDSWVNAGAGAIAGGAAGAVMNRNGVQQRFAQIVADSASPEEFDTAIAGMRKSRQQGYDTVINQHMPRYTPLNDIVNEVVQSGSGAKLTEAFRGQPGQLAAKADELQFAARNLGKWERPDVNIPEANFATKKIARKELSEIENATKNEYRRRITELYSSGKQDYGAEKAAAELSAFEQKAGMELLNAQVWEESGRNAADVTADASGMMRPLPEGAVSTATAAKYDKLLDEYHKLKTAADSTAMFEKTPGAVDPRTWQTMKVRIGELLDRTAPGSDKRQLVEQIIESIGGLEYQAKEAGRAVSLMPSEGKGTDFKDIEKLLQPSKQASHLNVTKNILRDLLFYGMGPNREKYKEASSMYSQMMEAGYSPAKRSVLGEVAGTKKDAVKAAQSVQTGQNYYTVMDKGAQPGTNFSATAKLNKTMAKHDPALQATLFKDWFAKKLSDLETPSVGAIDQNMPKQTIETLTPEVLQAIRDGASALVEVDPRKKVLFIRGAENMAKHAKLMSNRPAQMTELSRKDVEGMTGNSVENTAITMAAQPLARGSIVPKMLRTRSQAAAYGYLAERMTTPEGVEEILKLAKLKPGSPAFMTALDQYARAEVNSE